MIALLLSLFLALTLVFVSLISVLLSPTSAILYQLFLFNLVSAFFNPLLTLSSYLSIFLAFSFQLLFDFLPLAFLAS